MGKQFTVDSLRNLLAQISNAGYGDMEIFIGESYPLMDDAVVIDFYHNKMTMKNTYYDKQMAEAMRRARDDMAAVYRRYLQDCYGAGRIIEEDKES